MRTIASLFGKSPFVPIQKHMERTKSCVDFVKPMFEALMVKDFDKITDYGLKISELEHEADKLKNEIRDHLPKSLFLPVSRGDLARLVKQQDSIADTVEDIAFLLQMRKMEMPEELRSSFNVFLDSVIKTFDAVYEIVLNFDNLIEVSFDGPEANSMLAKIKKLGTLEWEADKVQFDLLKMMFDIEDKMEPVSIMLWSKIFNKIGDIANYSENTGDLMRMIIAS